MKLAKAFLGVRRFTFADAALIGIGTGLLRDGHWIIFFPAMIVGAIASVTAEQWANH